MHHAPGCTHRDHTGLRGRDGVPTIDEVRAISNTLCAVPQTPAGQQTGGEGYWQLECCRRPNEVEGANCSEGSVSAKPSTGSARRV